MRTQCPCYAHAMPMLCPCYAHAMQHVEADAHNRRGDTALTEAARAGKVAPHHAAAPRCRTALLRLHRTPAPNATPHLSSPSPSPVSSLMSPRPPAAEPDSDPDPDPA